MRIVTLVFGFGTLLAAAEPNWDATEKHALDLLRHYVQLQTVNPPANTTRAAELFRDELKAAGLQARLFATGSDGQTNLMVRLPGKDRTKKPLLLLNHFDVVPVDAKAWPVDPFAADIRDGAIWGRGTLDMKGVGVMQLTSLILLKQLGIVPARDIVMICTADEESSGVKGIQWMVEHHYADFEPEYVLDEGGAGSNDLFSSGRLVFGIAVGEKQISWLKLRAKGTAGHGSQPIADNANMTLLHAIQMALEPGRPTKPNPVVEALKKNIGAPLADNKYVNAIQRNTISLTTLTSGVGTPVKSNVIPSTAEATLDCRLLPGVNADEFLSELKARINDPRVTVERTNNPVDAGASRIDTPLFAAMRAALLKAHPKAIVTPTLIPFGTDSVFLRKRGVIAYGFIPMVVDTATIATMHSDAERIPVDQFLKGLHIYFDVLRSEF